MPRTAIAVVALAFTGATLGLTASDTVNGNSIANSSGKVYVHLRNSGASSRTATFVAVTTSRPADSVFPVQTVSNAVVTVAAGVEKIVGPIPAAYMDASGVVSVDGSHAELLISPFSIP